MTLLVLLNLIGLAGLGGVTWYLRQSQQLWESDRTDRAAQITDIHQKVADVEADIRERKAEEVDFQAKEVDAAKRDPAETQCLTAVRSVIERLDAGEDEILVEYDDPCGVPVSGRWYISNE